MSDIRFEHATALFALWGLVPLALLLWHAARRRRLAAERLLRPRMGEKLMPAKSRARTVLQAALVLLAFASLTFAAARPRFGVTYAQVQERGADIVVLLDVSRSMLSEDVYPNRLERSKNYLKDLLLRVRGDRVGLIAFAGRPVLACPLTTDHGFFAMTLDDVDTDTAPRGGTVIGDAIRLALETTERAPDRDQAFLLITDGEDHDSFPLEAAAQAKERGIRIFTVGIGDPESGSTVPNVRFEGEPVRSKLDENLLTSIATATGGAYVQARTRTLNLGDVYADHLAQLRAGELTSEKRMRHRERFQAFAGAGLGLLLLSLLVTPYRRVSRAAATAALALVCATFGAGSASAADTPKTDAARDKHNEAVALFEVGKTEEALAAFRAALELDPEFAPGAFGAGAALQREGKLDEALAPYREAAASGDAGAAAAAYHNLGTIAVAEARGILSAGGAAPEDAVGDTRAQAVDKIEEAIGSFRSTLRFDPAHEGARYNLELLRQWLKHMQDTWKKKDRERAAQKEDLAGLVEKAIETQRALKRDAGEQALAPRSPKRDADVATIASGQRDLASDVAAFDATIDAQFAAQPGQAPAGSGQQPDVAATLKDVAHAAGAAMEAAAEELDGGRPDGAVDPQHEAEAQLETLWSAVAQFPGILGRMVEIEDRVVEAAVPIVETAAAPPEGPALRALVEDQGKLATQAPLLGMHAKRLLEMAEQLAAQPPDPAQAQAVQQLASLKPACETASEHAPRIAELAVSTADLFGGADFAAALPQAEEIRRLLKEIRDLMPKDEQQQQQQQDQQQEGDQDQKEPKEKDPQQEGEQPQEQQPPDGEQESQPPPKLTEQQAEQLLRQALAREQEFKDKMKELQKAMAVPVKVEKDW